MNSLTVFVFAAMLGVALAVGQYYVPRAYYTIDAEGHPSPPVPLRRIARSLSPYPYQHGGSANANANAKAQTTGDGDATANANAEANSFGSSPVGGARGAPGSGAYVPHTQGH